jgi:hypothetical protein
VFLIKNKIRWNEKKNYLELSLENIPKLDKKSIYPF